MRQEIEHGYAKIMDRLNELDVSKNPDELDGTIAEPTYRNNLKVTNKVEIKF
jgi:hypothetical protein